MPALFRVLALFVCLMIVSGQAPAVSSAAAAVSSASVVRETQVSPTPTGLATRAWEPIVATHPTNPNYIAVVYPRGVSPVSSVLRISHDGGKTWRTSATPPFRGGIHPVIAWGRGPKAGSARLYYANMAGFSGAQYSATSYTDNEGATWSARRLETSTRPWVGGFQEITVDNNPASPNYGVVYVAYNWPASSTRGPGLHVIASADYGRTWKGLEIPVAPRPTGYGDTWRINYRLKTAANGSVYVSFYQLDMKYWSSTNIFAKGGSGNVGRIGFSVARFEFNRVTKVFIRHASVSAAKLPESSWNLGAWPAGTAGGLRTDPQWSTGLAVDQLTGRVYMTVGSSGTIRVYRSDTKGATWSYKTLPAAPAVNGRSQYSSKPNIVVGDGFVLVTLHTLDKSSYRPTVGNAYSVSYDGGATWSQPRAINATRWRDTYLSGAQNGAGLRDRADLTADGHHVFWAWGDGRTASAGRTGRSSIFGALIAVTIPAPVIAPTPTPVPTPEPTPTPTPLVVPAG